MEHAINSKLVHCSLASARGRVRRLARSGEWPFCAIRSRRYLRRAFGRRAGLGLLVGEPITGAMAGQALSEVGSDLAKRVLSPRQERRIAEVLVLAAAEIVAQHTLGEQIRDDGFFDGERSDAAEITEGILLAAMNEHEEAKLPYLANMLASIAFIPTIHVNTANRMLNAAERLTWLELRILAIIEAGGDEYPLPDVDLPHTGQSWTDLSVFNATSQLRSEARGLLTFPNREDQESMGIPLFDLRMSRMRLSSMGNLLAKTMRLGTVPQDQLETTYAALLRVPTSR